ncbi:TIGR03761 family integrating conjugative element protein [Salmonella enterica]|uniref:TIGR03761 family integrating conjugative element protein n=1 Tax=Salmonella newport TaxID=108619 RepID=A0A5U9VSX9_SALNE|nr:TIGR03761 family integrating conjugative element protein [Salmonella enterica subsp. enterica serovar Newport]ECB3300447.1 TIGR03761 family integrating conjugative element protein [Salmonella enterica subsp. enterica serovar Newport]EHI3121822.1 TIGR03761 family integrating conjugative element protein [Salmonella enterica]
MHEHEMKVPSVDKAQHITENPRSEVGVLHSEMKIELHTRYAILLWEGQSTEKKEKDRSVRYRRIIGMPFFLHLVGVINRDSYRDNPFADQTMFLLEEEFRRGIEAINGLITKLDNILHNIPARISLTEVLSVSPVNVSVFSQTPVGYRCVWLLVGFDQLALKAFQACHYGLISRSQRDDFLNQGSRFIRRAYGRALSYRSFPVTRRDVFEKTASSLEAEKHIGRVDPAIMLGEKRSAFSPPVNRRSIDALKNGHFADEDPPEGRIVVTEMEDNDESSESVDVPELSQTQEEEVTVPDNRVNELTESTDIDMDDSSSLLFPLSAPE